MKTITVRRDRGFYGMIRSLKLIVDGQQVGAIQQGQTVKLEIPDDSHEIWGEMDWAKTESVRLHSLQEETIIAFKSYFSFNFFKNVGIDTMPFKVFTTRQ